MAVKANNAAQSDRLQRPLAANVIPLEIEEGNETTNYCHHSRR